VWLDWGIFLCGITATFFYITSCVRELITLSSFLVSWVRTLGLLPVVFRLVRAMCAMNSFRISFFPQPFSVFIWCCFSYPNMINDHGCRLFGLPRGFRTPYMPCTSTHITPPWPKHFSCIFKFKEHTHFVIPTCMPIPSFIHLCLPVPASPSF